MPTKYLRKEPTTDELLSNPDYEFWFKKLLKKKDVVIYDSLDDVKANKNSGRWMWYCKNKPTKSRKTMLFCNMRCDLVWLDDI